MKERPINKSAIERVLIIMPTYNERDNIEHIVPAVLEVDSRIDVLIIDDNSPDGTGKIADELTDKYNRVKVFHRHGKLGLGTAYVIGFKYAIEQGYDFIFEMDADFSHDPKYIRDMISTAEEGYDLVIGSRWIDGGGIENWPKRREFLSRWASKYVHLITGLPVSDATAGFQAFRRAVLEEIHPETLKSDGYSFQIETKFRVWRNGFRIKEIPIIFRDRKHGESKISRHIIIEALFMVWRLKLNDIFGKT